MQERPNGNCQLHTAITGKLTLETITCGNRLAICYQIELARCFCLSVMMSVGDVDIL